GLGKIWILSLNADGTVYAQHAITQGESGFTEPLEYTDLFGCSLAAIGDLDGDGVVDLAVGARLDKVNSVRTGSVRILFLNADGTVKSVSTIATGLGGFTPTLDDLDQFGSDIALIGDLDGDGVQDLAIGARNERQTGVSDRYGAVYLLYMNTDGTV